MKAPRELYRFRIGELIQIGDAIATRHINEIGRIIEVRCNSHSRTLDKYVVRFLSGVEAQFWDIQIKKVSDDQLAVD